MTGTWSTWGAGRSAARIGVQPRTLAGGSAGAADWQSLAARRLALGIAIVRIGVGELPADVMGNLIFLACLVRRMAVILRAYPRTARGEGDSPLLFRRLHKRGQSPAVLG